VDAESLAQRLIEMGKAIGQWRLCAVELTLLSQDERAGIDALQPSRLAAAMSGLRARKGRQASEPAIR
jgi:hypothetical protein